MNRDFFRFCTSLKPLELKAMGELSSVRHLAEGEVVYSPGDRGDALFIINRGVLTVTEAGGQKKAAEVYLSRGDIFGDVEALTDLPRKHLVRTGESASLQCIERANFEELMHRVPSFFSYLSEHLAHRLSMANDLASARSHCLELSGSLANFDLVTIYQTIVNASQTGELRIMNDNSELVSAFYFDKGQPRFGQFDHLTGEEAFWQLFLAESLTGTFSFSSGDRPLTDWIQSEKIARQSDDMLIHALQGRDEFAELRLRIPSPDCAPVRRKQNLQWPSSGSPDLRPLAEQVWQLAYRAPVTVARLFRSCAVCELKIYRVMDELIRSHHFDLSAEDSSEKVA